MADSQASALGLRLGPRTCRSSPGIRSLSACCTARTARLRPASRSLAAQSWEGSQPHHRPSSSGPRQLLHACSLRSPRQGQNLDRSDVELLGWCTSTGNGGGALALHHGERTLHGASNQSARRLQEIIVGSTLELQPGATSAHRYHCPHPSGSNVLTELAFFF